MVQISTKSKSLHKYKIYIRKKNKKIYGQKNLKSYRIQIESINLKRIRLTRNKNFLYYQFAVLHECTTFANFFQILLTQVMQQVTMS